jgi:type I restriction enzyme S subunit
LGSNFYQIFFNLKNKTPNTITEILSDMDAEISALEEKLVKARQVKAGMMQDLLTGRVRLV